VQVARLEFHRPRFADSKFSIAVLNLLLVYTALAWVLVLDPEEPSLESELPLADAEVVAREAERATRSRAKSRRRRKRRLKRG
jgi:hypothetical protein